MASIYYRGQAPNGTWWLQFYHPQTGALLRQSLETSDHCRAELLRERAQLEIALLKPTIASISLPERFHRNLGGAPTVETGRCVAQPVLPSTITRTTVETAVKEYVTLIRAENSKGHYESKLSILRYYFGSDTVRKATGNDSGPEITGAFDGKFVDEMTASGVDEFIRGRPIETTTRRHYRELFHHFFEVLLTKSLVTPTNFHTPNIMSALPYYGGKKYQKAIVYLKEDDADEQLRVLEPCPSLRAAAIIMIEAGLRRNEALWLSKIA